MNVEFDKSLQLNIFHSRITRKKMAFIAAASALLAAVIIVVVMVCLKQSNAAVTSRSDDDERDGHRGAIVTNGLECAGMAKLVSNQMKCSSFIFQSNFDN